MLREMSAKQFYEWLMFYQLEPFGEDREDARFASIVQVLMNAYRNTKKRTRPYLLGDAVLVGGDIEYPVDGAPKQRQAWQAMKAFAMRAMAVSKEGAA